MDAERRQITVLFTDMVDFTSFSERAGEESAFTLMQAIARLMEDTVREQGGSVRGFTGDGIMAIFGAPVAFEDASLRACRAALLINERLIEATGALETKFGVTTCCVVRILRPQQFVKPSKNFFLKNFQKKTCVK